MPGGRVDQTSVAGVLRDHRARLRALEAVSGTQGASMTYSPNLAAINPSRNIDWGAPAPDSGSQLFDFSGGNNYPAALRTGIYIVSLWARRSVGVATAGDYAQMTLTMDVDNDDVIMLGEIPLNMPPPTIGPAGTVTASYRVPAGSHFQASIAHGEGVPLSFQGTLQVGVVYL